MKKWSNSPDFWPPLPVLRRRTFWEAARYRWYWRPAALRLWWWKIRPAQVRGWLHRQWWLWDTRADHAYLLPALAWLVRETWRRRRLKYRSRRPRLLRVARWWCVRF